MVSLRSKEAKAATTPGCSLRSASSSSSRKTASSRNLAKARAAALTTASSPSRSTGSAASRCVARKSTSTSRAPSAASASTTRQRVAKRPDGSLSNRSARSRGTAAGPNATTSTTPRSPSCSDLILLIACSSDGSFIVAFDSFRSRCVASRRGRPPRLPRHKLDELFSRDRTHSGGRHRCVFRHNRLPDHAQFVRESAERGQFRLAFQQPITTPCEHVFDHALGGCDGFLQAFIESGFRPDDCVRDPAQDRPSQVLRVPYDHLVHPPHHARIHSRAPPFKRNEMGEDVTWIGYEGGMDILRHPVGVFAQLE